MTEPSFKKAPDSKRPSFQAQAFKDKPMESSEAPRSKKTSAAFSKKTPSERFLRAKGSVFSPKEARRSSGAKTEDRGTGWEPISQWYDQCVGQEGHFYHRELILPKLKEHLRLDKLSSVLDLGCGQGVLERLLGAKQRYLGVDASRALLKSAQNQVSSKEHRFLECDLNSPQVFDANFEVAIFLLSLQNMSEGQIAIQSAAKALENKGRLALVLNHPCFRIPRQSEWTEHTDRKSLMRSLHSYMSPQSIPIQAHPGKTSQEKNSSMSYHHSLSDLMGWLESAGLKISHLEEWTGTKLSTGAKARMENRARLEFPLFLYIVATKS